MTKISEKDPQASRSNLNLNSAYFRHCTTKPMILQKSAKTTQKNAKK